MFPKGAQSQSGGNGSRGHGEDAVGGMERRDCVCRTLGGKVLCLRAACVAGMSASQSTWLILGFRLEKEVQRIPNVGLCCSGADI